MKTVYKLSSLVFLAAFGPSCGPGNAYYQCPDVPNWGTVSSEAPIDCAAFAANSALAFHMLDNVGVVPLGADHDFSRWSVIVEAGDTLRDHPGDVGYTTLDYAEGQVIYLARTGTALLHESLHAWQVMHGVLDTGSHPHWCAMGWGSATDSDCPQSLAYKFEISAENVSHGKY